MAFGEEDGLDFYVLYILEFTEIVHVMINLHLIQTTQQIQPSGVIMIPMDREYWQLYLQVFVQIVGFRILISLERDRILMPKHMLIEYFACLIATLFTHK